jgi:DNA repair protein RadC
MEMHMFETYKPAYAHLAEPERQTIYRALALLKESMTGPVFDSPDAVKDYLTLKYADLKHEVFGVLWLDAQHRLSSEEVLFRGTLNQTSVYPREVVMQGLHHNAGAAIVFHNHPSGLAEPSRADEFLTRAIKDALAIVDIRLLDHVIVATGGAVSLASRGCL